MAKKKSFFKTYGFIIFMLAGIIGGCVVGALNPVVKDASGEVISKGATVLEPIGTVFVNLMFCVVVPMVFCSISSAIANMSSAKRAGKVMGITVGTFFVTAAIAAVIMYVIVRLCPVVTGSYTIVEGEVDTTLSVTDMIINFFTKPDFGELWSRKAILPLIIAAVFFGFFAYLVATYGPDLIGDYSRTLIIYYVLCFAYMFVFFPIYARFGGGKGGAKVMWKHLFRPAAVSFGTCSSVATIPTNLEVAEETGISKEVSNIVVPLGATMHMDGSAMSAIIKVAFLFGIFGMDFGTGQAILAIIVAVFSSVAMSGIPGGGGTGELVLCTLFFPDQLAVAFPIALAIGNLVDPPATMVNAAGDYVVSFIVERFVNGKDWLQKKLAKDGEKKIEA